MSQQANSMGANWCAARVAEARAWRDANSQRTPGWQHVHELLSQLDNPPAVALPQNVVPMPAEKRAELKRLAEAATPGFWISEGNCVYDSHQRDVLASESMSGRREDAAYIAAVSPDVALATLAYVEALEAERDEWKAGYQMQKALLEPMQARIAEWEESFSKQYHELAEGQGYCEELSRALDAATARATKAESREAELKQELAEQEREKLALIRQLPPEGDGGLWALQSLEDYFREGGHRAALANIRAAAHNMGWCLDDMGADQIAPTTGICPLCEHNSAPHPAPTPPPSSPAAAGPGEAKTYAAYCVAARASGSTRLSEKAWQKQRRAAPTTTGEGKEGRADA